jgi:hypothetical protein
MDPEPRLDWLYWRERMANSSRCDAGRTTGEWALGVLETQLSVDWLKQIWARERLLPPEVVQSSFHALAFADLLSMSASLELAQNLPGHARVRKSLRTDLREQARHHSMLLLELGMLGRWAGASVALEPVFEGGRSPGDVLIELDGVRLAVEARVILFDDGMRAGRDLSERLSAQINHVTFTFGVQLVGEVIGDLNEQLTITLVPEVERAAQVAVAEHRRVPVEHPQAQLEVMPQDLAVSGMAWGLPAGETRGWARTVRILQDKATQMRRSGAEWLRIDVRDGLWQFSAWSQSPLADKTEVMAGALRAILGDIGGVRGVVLSCGCADTLSKLTNQSVEVSSAHGLVRDLGNFKGREMLVVPLAGDAEAEARAWLTMYDSEPRWLDAALGELGHPPMSGLTTVRDLLV